MQASAPSGRLTDWLFTTDPVQRVRLSQAGLALMLMAVCVGVMHYIVAIGGAAAGPVWWWTIASAGGLVATWVAIRSGWSRRFEDPSLTVPQMIYAVACSAVAYAMAGPLRGVVFLVLMLILMFGMFQLRPRTVAAMGLYSVALFGAVMALMAVARPDVYRPEVEFGHFLMVATMLPAVAVLSSRLWRTRDRARRQKDALSDALERIQQLATHDELTSLINRRHMIEVLEQERQRCVRSGQGFCVALLCVDGLDRIRLERGRAGGDAVLRTFAQTAQAAIRAADVLARWEGGEFVLLLTDTRATLARAGLERLRERVAAVEMDVGGGAVERVTVSAGLVQHIAGETVTQALDRAERALFDAKGQGRNRVVNA